jgi:uncharacterized membrane protein
LAQWPAYVASLTSFLYVGIVWQNHHAAFSRIRHIDRGLHWVNLAILFTAALLPFPTAVVSYAVHQGVASDDARTAVAFSAMGVMLLCASWYARGPVIGRASPQDASPRTARIVRHARTASCRLNWTSGSPRSWPEISRIRRKRYLSVLRCTARERAVAS